MGSAGISSTGLQKLTPLEQEKEEKFKPNVTCKVGKRGGTKQARQGQSW